MYRRSFSWKTKAARSRQDSDDAVSSYGQTDDDDDANTVGCASASTSPSAWTYERVSCMQQVAAAVEAPVTVVDSPVDSPTCGRYW